MTANEPLELYYSWPRADRDARFELGLTEPTATVTQARGWWSCDLADDTLHWDDRVKALFGFPPDPAPLRTDALSCYDEASRAAMERLRAHAIRHRRGFTLDIRITPVGAAAPRWLRLGAAPVCTGGRAVRLEGYKADVTVLYGV